MFFEFVHGVAVCVVVPEVAIALDFEAGHDGTIGLERTDICTAATFGDIVRVNRRKQLSDVFNCLAILALCISIEACWCKDAGIGLNG